MSLTLQQVLDATDPGGTDVEHNLYARLNDIVTRFNSSELDDSDPINQVVLALRTENLAGVFQTIYESTRDIVEGLYTLAQHLQDIETPPSE